MKCRCSKEEEDLLAYGEHWCREGVRIDPTEVYRGFENGVMLEEEMSSACSVCGEDNLSMAVWQTSPSQPMAEFWIICPDCGVDGPSANSWSRAWVARERKARAMPSWSKGEMSNED